MACGVYYFTVHSARSCRVWQWLNLNRRLRMVFNCITYTDKTACPLCNINLSCKVIPVVLYLFDNDVNQLHPLFNDLMLISSIRWRWSPPPQTLPPEFLLHFCPVLFSCLTSSIVIISLQVIPSIIFSAICDELSPISCYWRQSLAKSLLDICCVLLSG